MPGIFYPFKVHYGDSKPEAVKKKSQAEQILDEVDRLHKLGYKQVGITYSANQDQTNAIQATYAKTDGSWKTGTAGGNQAAVMQEVERRLASKKYKHLQQVFRIVPITTMKSSGSPNPATDQEVQSSLSAADTFMKGEGHVLLGWQNQNTKGKKLAIGGALAKNITTPDQTNMIEAWVDATMKSAIHPPKYVASATSGLSAPAALASQPPTIPLPSSQEKGPCTATVETISENGETPSGTERDDFFKKLDDFLTTRNNQQPDNSKHVTAKYNSDGKIELSGSLEDVKAAISEFSKQNPETLHVLFNQNGEIICGFKNGEPMNPEQCKEIMKNGAELNPAADMKDQAADMKEKLQSIIPPGKPPNTDPEDLNKDQSTPAPTT